VASLLDRIGEMALAWDVAAPTLREQPDLLATALATETAAAPVRETPAPTSLAGVALELGELDDVWFAKAQAMVRRALLARAAQLGLDRRDDVFWLALDTLDQELDPVAAASRAAAARSAADRARAWSMPLVAGEIRAVRVGQTAGDGEWHGIGAGHATGRVMRLQGASVVAPGTIVVARTITPALALLVHGAAALVSETGGILAHGAAIARELGIPFVVGCDGVWAELEDGDLIEVNGDAGLVRRLEER
jgi:pyruvate,water dikinase